MSSGEKRSQGAETILVVDDDETVRALIRECLERNGYKVLEARFATEPFVILRQHEGPIHLMIADVMMPGLAGPELAARLSSSRPGMKVLYISGYPEEVVREKMRSAEKAPLLHKPFAPEILLTKVQEMLSAPKDK